MLQKMSNITLVAVATKEIEETAKALEYSQRGLEFEEVLFFASHDPCPEGKGNYSFHKIPAFKDVGEWGKFIIFELHKFIRTKYIILIHADGFIVHPEEWTQEFLDYDYIGAPWPLPKDTFSYRDGLGNIIRVGNSVSLRSKKILELPEKLGLEWGNADHGYFHEDGFLCVQHREALMKSGIKFSPLSVACRFSRERTIPENKDIKPFAFHKWQGKNKNYPRFTRRATLWDVLKKLIIKYNRSV